jgi:hypothetical protein
MSFNEEKPTCPYLRFRDYRSSKVARVHPEGRRGEVVTVGLGVCRQLSIRVLGERDSGM